LNARTNWFTNARASVAVQFADPSGGTGAWDDAVTLLEVLLVAGAAWGPDPVHAPISETDATNASERASRLRCRKRVLMPIAPGNLTVACTFIIAHRCGFCRPLR
jgi:hypothetical protein